MLAEISKPTANSIASSVATADILGDALVGIVGLGGAGFELVLAAFMQPAVGQPARQPFAPTQLQQLLQVKLVHGGRHRQRRPAPGTP